MTYYENNVAATLSLLQIMDQYDCTRIVYSSSATVYGTPPIIPIPETTRLQADSPYGKSKVMCELIIDDLCHGNLLENCTLFMMLKVSQLNLVDGGDYRSVTSSKDCLLFTPADFLAVIILVLPELIPPVSLANTHAEDPVICSLCWPIWPLAASKNRH